MRPVIPMRRQEPPVMQGRPNPGRPATTPPVMTPPAMSPPVLPAAEPRAGFAAESPMARGYPRAQAAGQAEPQANLQPAQAATAYRE